MKCLTLLKRAYPFLDNPLNVAVADRNKKES
jgi:hypothetical protein